MVVLGLLLDWEKVDPAVQMFQGLISWGRYRSPYCFVSVSELQSRRFKLIILEAAVFGVTVGGIGGPFHQEKPCAVVWDTSVIGMAFL